MAFEPKGDVMALQPNWKVFMAYQPKGDVMALQPENVQGFSARRCCHGIKVVLVGMTMPRASCTITVAEVARTVQENWSALATLEPNMPEAM
eukprot:6491496-Amphidinium_carterae.1